jgi:hypothetical protein
MPAFNLIMTKFQLSVATDTFEEVTMTQTAANDVRITYPLNDNDIKELEELETKLKKAAGDAETNKRVALHSVYGTILKNSTTTIARAKMRSARESNAERTRRHKSLKKTVKEEVLNGTANGNASGTAGNATAAPNAKAKA